MLNSLGPLESPNYLAAFVSGLLIFCGLFALRNLHKDSPMAPYILQILGLTFILPVVLLAGVLLKIQSEAIVGLLGTIVGYVFGTSRVTQERQGPRENGEDDTDRRGRR